MTVLSGWCGQRGKPAHQWCKSMVCACDCHDANPAQNKSFGPELAAEIRENRGTSKDAPAGAANTCESGANRYEGAADAY